MQPTSVSHERSIAGFWPRPVWNGSLNLEWGSVYPARIRNTNEPWEPTRMKLVNRQAAVTYLQQPFVDWINSVEAQSGGSTRLTIEEVNQEAHVYLLDYHEPEEANLEYVDEFKPEIFEFELSAWYSDPGLWPEARSVEFIDRWLRIDLHSMLIDLERSRLKKREA